MGCRRSSMFWVATILSTLLLSSFLGLPELRLSRMAKEKTLYQQSVSLVKGLVNSEDVTDSGDPLSRKVAQQELKINVTNQRTVFFIPGLHLYIHRAFRDERLEHHSVIRIFGLEKRDAVNGTFACQWVTERDDDVTAKNTVSAEKYSIDTSWPHWGFFYACSFDCLVPKHSRIQTVHLVSKEHGFDFELEIEKAIVLEPRRDLAVCVKPLTGKFNPAWFVEWIEMQRLVGIEHFILYDTDLQGSSRFVLDYYADRRIVTLVKFPYLNAILKKVEPPQLTSQNRYAVYQQVYLVAYQDCLYRFMNAYKFLEIIDIDEIMLPTAEENWPLMLNKLLDMNPNAASFMFWTSWHFEESGIALMNGTKAPPYMYMQRYAIANTPMKSQPKSVTVTERAVAVNHHGVVQTIRPEFRVRVVPWEESGAVHHFRGTCKGKFQPDRCEAMMKGARVDTAVTRYRHICQILVKQVLEFLQVIHV